MEHKIVFALLACLAFQGVFGNVVESKSSIESYEVAEEVQKALEKLKEIVDKVVTDAIDTFNKILNTILELAKGIVVSGTDSIGEKVKEIIQKINDLVGNAESSGVDVTECVFGKNEEIASIPETLIKQMVRCVEDNIEKAKKIINQAIDDVNSVLGIVVKLEKEVKNCGIGITSIPCLGKVLVQITLETAQIPITVAKHVAQVVAYVATVEAKLAQCEANAVATAGSQLGNVFNDVAKCIQDKIQNKIDSERLRIH